MGSSRIIHRKNSSKVNFGRGGQKLNNSLREYISHFKSTRYSRLPLVEYIEAVVSLISAQMVNETRNGVQEDAVQKLNGVF